jgi:hypothetical protein
MNVMVVSFSSGSSERPLSNNRRDRIGFLYLGNDFENLRILWNVVHPYNIGVVSMEIVAYTRVRIRGELLKEILLLRRIGLKKEVLAPSGQHTSATVSTLLAYPEIGGPPNASPQTHTHNSRRIIDRFNLDWNGISVHILSSRRLCFSRHSLAG